MEKERCCLMHSADRQCAKTAEWGVLSQDQGPEMVTYACDEHLSVLLEPGTSSVWPLRTHEAMAEKGGK